MIGQVGLSPEKYWSYTLRENGLLAQAFTFNDELRWMQTRRIEYSNYVTTFGPTGKKIFKGIKQPKDLYELPSEIIKRKTEGVFDPERAWKAYNMSNNKPEWHKKT